MGEMLGIGAGGVGVFRSSQPGACLRALRPCLASASSRACRGNWRASGPPSPMPSRTTSRSLRPFTKAPTPRSGSSRTFARGSSGRSGTLWPMPTRKRWGPWRASPAPPPAAADTTDHAPASPAASCFYPTAAVADQPSPAAARAFPIVAVADHTATRTPTVSTPAATGPIASIPKFQNGDTPRVLCYVNSATHLLRELVKRAGVLPRGLTFQDRPDVANGSIEAVRWAWMKIIDKTLGTAADPAAITNLRRVHRAFCDASRQR